ncbi:hypothetical protein ZWY2020_057891 [Hordeum vulgare]|nr:hypothetical protein ZWY2020_057891 [Hordeum vulgare]
MFHAFDPDCRCWLCLPFTSFLPHQAFSPVASFGSLLYLWALAVCNPGEHSYRLLPLLDPPGHATTLLAGPAASCLSSPSSPRLLPLSEGSGKDEATLRSLRRGAHPSRWRTRRLRAYDVGTLAQPVEADPAQHGRCILMIGGLVVLPSMRLCSTVLILRLDLSTMEWDEAGWMLICTVVYWPFMEAAAQRSAMFLPCCWRQQGKGVWGDGQGGLRKAAFVEAGNGEEDDVGAAATSGLGDGVWMVYGIPRALCSMVVHSNAQHGTHEG